MKTTLTGKESNNFYTKEKAFFFAFWLLTVARPASIMVVDDPDLWGHVLYGMEHLSVGTLSRVDPSVTLYMAHRGLIMSGSANSCLLCAGKTLVRLGYGPSDFCSSVLFWALF